jgi:UDP-N-acetylmuramyl pentapeptide phosphotransferase/UDP-N-acetylglucosamine-1-phosphate transferase
LVDDIHNLGPWKKLLAQVLAASLIIFACDLRIDSFYGLFGINEIPYLISIIITLLFIVGIINGFNLIDGIDGLASAIGILASLVTGIFFITADKSDSAIISFSLAGALITFFCFNVFGIGNKIYMGDTGSMLTGHIISFQILQFLGSESGKYNISLPVIAFTVLIVPIFDTLRVIVIRLLNRKSPFKADKNHMHHLLLKFGFSHLGATVILSSATICFVIAGIIFNSLREFAIISILVVSTTVAMWLGRATRGLSRNIETEKEL